MPFANSTAQLIKRTIVVDPEYGFGWAVVENNSILENLATPNQLRAQVAEVVVDSGVQALVCTLAVRFSKREFKWAAFIPRTTLVIDLCDRSVGCNILFSQEKPIASQGKAPSDPDYIWSNSTTHVRGFGRVA